MESIYFSKYLEIRNFSLEIFKNFVYSPRNLLYMACSYALIDPIDRYQGPIDKITQKRICSIKVWKTFHIRMLLRSFKKIAFWNQLRSDVKLTKHVQSDKSLWVKSWSNIEVVCKMTIMLQNQSFAASCSDTFGKF